MKLKLTLNTFLTIEIVYYIIEKKSTCCQQFCATKFI